MDRDRELCTKAALTRGLPQAEAARAPDKRKSKPLKSIHHKS